MPESASVPALKIIHPFKSLLGQTGQSLMEFIISRDSTSSSSGDGKLSRKSPGSLWTASQLKSPKTKTGSSGYRINHLRPLEAGLNRWTVIQLLESATTCSPLLLRWYTLSPQSPLSSCTHALTWRLQLVFSWICFRCHHSGETSSSDSKTGWVAYTIATWLWYPKALRPSVKMPLNLPKISFPHSQIPPPGIRETFSLRSLRELSAGMETSNTHWMTSPRSISLRPPANGEPPLFDAWYQEDQTDYHYTLTLINKKLPS